MVPIIADASSARPVSGLPRRLFGPRPSVAAPRSPVQQKLSVSSEKDTLESIIKVTIRTGRFKGMSDRRAEPRFAADQPVVVSVVTPIPGKIDSASKSGLRVTVSKPVKAGATVEIKWDRVIVVGQVRYCHKIGPRTYSIGLKVTEVVGGGKLLQIKPNAA